jgi:hypothetical protein
MKREMLALGVLFIAVFVVGVNYGGYGQICSDAVELPKSEQYVDMQVENLLGYVSQAINAVEHTQTYAQISDMGGSYLPQEAVILQAGLSDVEDIKYLEENVKDTLNRVGDLAFSLIGDKELVILVDKPYSSGTYGYFMLDKKVLEDPSRCQYTAFTDKEQKTLQQLGIFADLLDTTLPGNSGYVRYCYIPGFGGYVGLSIDYGAPQELVDWTCEDWKTYLAENVKRISDLLFDSFGEGETLTLRLYTPHLQYPLSSETFFVLNKETAANSSEWEAYFR